MNDILNTGALRALEVTHGEKILDLGAGLGQLSRAMARAAGPRGKVIGVERSPDQIREAERLARDAVALAERTDYLNDHAGALEDLARVHDAVGDSEGARHAREAALDVYRRKGNAVSSVRLEQAIAGVAS